MTAHVLPKCARKKGGKDAGDPETFSTSVLVHPFRSMACTDLLPLQHLCQVQANYTDPEKEIKCVRASVVSPAATVELSRGLSGK
ncbi:uncharacterized [Tachysurus ichikawai]